MADPKLRVRSSGFGGSGYGIPTWLTEAGKPTIVPSVTTITGVTAKPGIVQWAVDQTAAYAVANVDALLSRTEEQGWGMLRWYHKRQPDALGSDLLNYHAGVLNDAAELGTAVHEWIEADLTDGFPPEITTEPMAEMVARWLEFKAANTIEPILVEVTAVNREHGYAGTLDGLWRINGVPTLVDVKTSRNTWPEHFQQLAALGACYNIMVEVDALTANAVEYNGSWWVEDVMPDFSEYRILHLRPTDYDNDGNVIESFCKLKSVEDIDLHFEGFLGALALKKYERELTARNKNKKTD